MNTAVVIVQLGWTLLDFTWQGALIACFAGAGLVALRNSSPRARYALACTALFACLAWPAASLWQRLMAPDAVLADSLALALQAGAAPARAAPAAWLQAHLGMLVLGWAAGACALSLRMVLGLWWIRRAATFVPDGAALQWQGKIAAMAPRFGIARAVRLRIVDSIASPLTAGWWRPVILLPASLLTGMPADLLEALIAHELGHIRRGDYLVNLLQNVIETLLFYHPAVWWLSKRIRDERELIADDLAVAYLGQPRSLALALSELEKCQFSGNQLASAANGGDLMHRIKRLLRPTAPSLHWKAALPVLGLTVALVAGCAQMTAPALTAAPGPASVSTKTPLHTKALAQFASCRKPVWPKEALRNEVTGTVHLEFLVGTDGMVRDSRIAHSSGSAELDEAARSGIAVCRFSPATDDGVPVQAWSKMQYVWTLQ